MFRFRELFFGTFLGVDAGRVDRAGYYVVGVGVCMYVGAFERGMVLVGLRIFLKGGGGYARIDCGLKA